MLNRHSYRTFQILLIKSTSILLLCSWILGFSLSLIGVEKIQYLDNQTIIFESNDYLTQISSYVGIVESESIESENNKEEKSDQELSKFVFQNILSQKLCVSKLNANTFTEFLFKKITSRVYIIFHCLRLHC